ncbi:MAG TPA: peptidylprolyl isomerase, partial [Verrucomicrobiae bacterium]|nr:peptidylprolyl isomerase [Verrucomicrobiae bacterium]
AGAEARAESALKQLQHGTDFGTLATQVSEDPATKTNGGQYGAPITQSDRDIAPAVTTELFKLKPGQISGIINTGYTLEIVKVIDRSSDSLHAAHIQFNLQDITTYTKPLAAKEPAHRYIKV